MGVGASTGEGSSESIPPPGPAQALVARAGYVVYEGGHDIFTEPVLVFMGADGRAIGRFEVFDHLDRLLGRSRQLQGRLQQRGVPCGLYDQDGVSLLQAVPATGTPRVGFDVYGVASAQFLMKGFPGSLVIERDGELFGTVTGFGLSGLPGQKLVVSDHFGDPVAELQTVELDSAPDQAGAAVESMVLSIDPKLGGELRRLLIAIPMIVDQIRHRSKASNR